MGIVIELSNYMPFVPFHNYCHHTYMLFERHELNIGQPNTSCVLLEKLQAQS